jgi:hypothetical protein
LVLGKDRLNWESGGCETGTLKKKKKNGFQPVSILRRRIYTRMNCEIGDISSGLIHLGPDIIWFKGLGNMFVVGLYRFGKWRTCEAFASLLL